MSTKANLAFVSALFTLIAGYFLYVGFALTITIPTDGGDVANLQMMHLQSLDITIGIGAAIISAIFAVGSAVSR